MGTQGAPFLAPKEAVVVDPFTMLESDHRQAEQLMEQLADSEPGSERERLVAELTTALSLHMDYEENHVYPLTARVIDEESVQEAENEHRLARDGLSKLGELSSQPGFGAAVEMLKGGIGHHVDEEEHEMFPTLRKQVEPERQTQLAHQLLATKRTAGLLDQSLEKATKEQLIEMAGDFGLASVSSMNKKELIEALAALAR